MKTKVSVVYYFQHLEAWGVLHMGQKALQTNQEAGVGSSKLL